jgi:hypothetical protein
LGVKKQQETWDEFVARLDADPKHQANVARWRAEKEAESARWYEENTPALVKRLDRRLKDNGVNIGEGAAVGGALDLLLADKDAVESGVALIHACRKWADRHAHAEIISFVCPLLRSFPHAHGL